MEEEGLRVLSRREFLGAAAGLGAAVVLTGCPPPGPTPPMLRFVGNRYTTDLADPRRVKQINGRTSAWSNQINWSAANAIPPLVNNEPAQVAKRVDHMNAAVHGADMGVLWEDGLGNVIIAFGDSFGPSWTGPFATHAYPTEHRENTGARSSNRDLTRGVLFDDWLRRNYRQNPYQADRLVAPNTLGQRLKTRAPVAGCSVAYGSGRAQVMLISMIREYPTHFGATGLSAFSTLVWSPDGGRNWRDMTRAYDAPVWWNDSTGTRGFQQGALVVADDGYVYWFATRNTNATGPGPVQLARTRADAASMVAKSSWRYWNGSAWVADANQAATVIPAPADLISVRWNSHLRCWLMMFVGASSFGQYIGWRTALDLTGPWSMISTMPVPSHGAYCVQIHPWSTGPDLYFSVSMRDPYAAYLLHARIENPAAGSLTV